MTVDVAFVPDLETVTFSLFVPAVNLRNRAIDAPIETIGVLTSAKTSIGGPGLVQGQLTTYQALPLVGTAKLVDFLVLLDSVGGFEAGTGRRDEQIMKPVVMVNKAV